MPGPSFAVVDFETTGLFPTAHDRVIELAVLRVDLRGEILGEFTSLVNPNRDLGPTHVHGITAQDLLKAPSFESLAGDVLELLHDSVFVSHNVAFDLRFLQSELSRLGLSLPPIPQLCTMSLSRRADPHAPGRSLASLCRHFGLPLSRAHSAYDDALAAANLLWKCAESLGRPENDLTNALGVIAPDHAPCPSPWPSLRPSRSGYTRERAHQDRSEETSFLARLVERLPADSSGESLDEYLALLDRVLEDRLVEEHESRALLQLAEDLGLSRARATEAHRSYFSSLVRVALEDQVITPSERRDLQELARLLGIPGEDLDAIVEVVKKSMK